MKRAFTKLFSVPLIALLATACDDPAGPEASIVGTYTLQTIDGIPLPFTAIAEDVLRVEVLEGHITLSADQTFSTDLRLRLTQSGSPSTSVENDSGTYTHEDAVLRLTYLDGSMETGSIDGDRLTLASRGSTFVFER